MIVFSININDEDPVWTPELKLGVMYLRGMSPDVT